MLEKNDVSHLDAICALHWACYCGHPELVETLLNIGCDPHYPDDINLETPIYFAIRGSNVPIVQMLVQRFGTELLCHENRKRLTPFLLAASEFVEDNVISTLHMLEFLYLSGVSLEEQDASGRTALMLASRRGCQFVAQWLLSRGANLAHRDHLGNTVLHHACESGDGDTLRFLCKHGAIGLIGSKALAATAKEETALGICLMKRRFLQYSMLKMWSWQYALTGRLLAFRSPYPIYYWILAMINLALYWRIYATLETTTSIQSAIVDVWIVGWIISQCFWFITFASDPGKARKNPVMSQSHRTSSNFENDIMKDAPMLGGTFEAQMQSLQKQQELINYELYRINCDSFRRNSWVAHEDFSGELSEPLDPYGYAGEDGLAQRVQVCKEEAQILQTEMHALYPQVGMERQEHCVFGYADAVMGSVRDLGISTVCITCNMIRAARSHHCGTCGVCMVRQDHHCAWVDNCVAKGNQRAFCVFVSSVCISLCHTYYVMYLHFASEFARMKFDWIWDGPNIVFGVVGNAAWLAFVGYLCVRIARNMATDVTFYEYLRKPEHIRHRFKNQVQATFWDFADLSLLKAIANCGRFWVPS
ncbi:DHHC zinc finger domain ankyrin repeat containing protein [Babesia ovata]|uniref:Palmitoyltransferase n=1 Tax=Babesia ovata TaxID=189622 RepID=A0A2H6KFQ5_9APIC|nr:DHHC zinc finger domain ankyrin repeat containing protein [Babesia ovata]GBE61833.1 DHHC zinc finger domain ankyrin repeat containing protein [Babesia ovata]